MSENKETAGQQEMKAEDLSTAGETATAFDKAEADSAPDGNQAEPEAGPAEGGLGRLCEENVQLLARLQRLQADFDNYRKRVKTERQEWSTQALCDLVRELLPVLDNLERARQAAVADQQAEALLAGVELVYRQLLAVLEKEGLCSIEARGTLFDPTCHHAIMQVESDQPENTVVDELQKGYRFKDRVIRASMVRVAKLSNPEEGTK